MDNVVHKGALGLLIAFVLFIGATIIEVAITIWAFKKYGGCPMMDKHK
jgi:chromate transport protein ChrA